MSDHQDQLDEKRICLLSGDIEDVSVKPIAERLLLWNTGSNGQSQAATLVVSSFGGSTHAAWALVDIMEYVSFPVKTVGLGSICSAAFLIFVAGTKGQRILTPKTSIMCHRYLWGWQQQHEDLVARRVEEDRTHDRIIDHLVAHTNLNRAEVLKELLSETDRWLSAKEAKAFGITDIIRRIPKQ